MLGKSQERRTRRESTSLLSYLTCQSGKELSVELQRKEEAWRFPLFDSRNWKEKKKQKKKKKKTPQVSPSGENGIEQTLGGDSKVVAQCCVVTRCQLSPRLSGKLLHQLPCKVFPGSAGRVARGRCNLDSGAGQIKPCAGAAVFLCRGCR